MRIRSLLAAAALLAVALPDFANAATAYTIGGMTNLRAGPGTHYPIRARIRGDTEVDVLGCLRLALVSE